MSLPKFHTQVPELEKLQTRWAQILDQFLGNPSLNCLLLKDITLAVGANVINHKLGRTQQGWRIVDINGIATIYRSTPLNASTLTLTSDAVVTVALEVF